MTMSNRDKELLLLEVASRIAAGAVSHSGFSKIPHDLLAKQSVQIAEELIKITSKEVLPAKMRTPAKRVR